MSALCSARATAASLAEAMRVAVSKFLTVIFSPGKSQILEPGVSAAFWETVTISSNSFSSRMIMAVISLVRLAMGVF